MWKPESATLVEEEWKPKSAVLVKPEPFRPEIPFTPPFGGPYAAFPPEYGEKALQALGQVKGLVRGVEQMVGTAGSMVQWASDQSPLANTYRVIKAKSVLSKLRDPNIPKAQKKALAEEFKKDHDWLSNKAAKWADWWNEQANKGWEAPDPEIMEAKWKERPIAKGIATISEAAPNYLAAIALSVLTKSPQTGLLFISGISGAGAYRRQREKNVNKLMANAVALLTAAWEYATEKVPFEAVFKPSKSLLLKMLKVGTLEAAQEFVQGIGENFLEYFGYTAKDLATVPAAAKEGLLHAMDGWIENVVAGFGLGFLGGLVGGRRTGIAKTQQFKDFALTKEGAGIVAALDPEIAAEIAAKEQPSRGDLKKLGVTGWNAEERKQLSSLFRDVLADQERMAHNQRAIEQLEEAEAWRQREAEKAKAAETAETPTTEAIPEPTEAVAGQKPAEAVKVPPEAKDPDKYREDMVKKWGEEKFDKVWFELAEGGMNERFSDIGGQVADLDEAGKFDSAEAKRLRIEMDSIVDAELEKREVKAEKEIEYEEEEAITEPTPSPAVEPGKAGKLVPTGQLDPTNPKEALEIIRLHAKWVAYDKSRPVWEGIYSTKWDKDKLGYVKDVVDYSSEEVDTAYRTIQKPVESPMPDTELFAMPGKEKQMKAIAAKMAKVKGVYRPKKRGTKLTKPAALPKAKTKKEDHVKAVYMIAPKESTRYALTGVKVEGDILVATDGRRLFWAKGKWGKDGLYLDAASLKKGSIGKATKEKVNFPQWRDIVPDVSDQKPIIVDLEDAWSHVRQAEILTSEESKGVMIIENKDERAGLGFATSAPEVGHAEINVYEGGRILGAVNPQFLMDVFKFHAIRGDTAFEFYFIAPDRPILTKSLDGKTNTLTMPINPGEPSESVQKAIAEFPPVAEKPKSKGLKKKPAKPGEKKAPGVSRIKAGEETVGGEGRIASYVIEPAETKAGEKLLRKLREDAKRSGRKKVGLRSIVDYLNSQLRAMMLVGKTQLTKKHPARYESGPHIIRTKSGVWQLNFHEAGHALSAMIEAEKPAWFAHISKMLLEMTGPGTMASAETPEEGLAELCRQYVINPGKIPSQIKQQFESLLNELRPDLLAAFRDTHRAYTYHTNRPYTDLQQSLTYDKPVRGSAEQIANYLWDLGQGAVGDSMITHRLTRKIFNEIAEKSWLEKKVDVIGIYGTIKGMMDKAYASRLKLAREARREIESGIANYDSARQAILRIPQEVEAAMSGVKGKKGRSKLNGITVLAVGEGFDIFSDKELSALTEAGFELPQELNPGHGERIYIHPKSFNDIKYDVAGRSKDHWDEFCAYGQGKAELNRWKTKRLAYPGMRTGLEPDKMSRYIAQQEMEHPDWKEHFKAVNKYMDQLLLVPLLTQEKTVAEVIRIKKAWTDYWPLPRQIEGRPLTARTKGTDYSSGIKSAFGSSLPLETLDKAVRMRTRMAFEAYGMHGFLTSLINLGPELDKIKGLSFNAKKMINRIMLPLRLDIKKIGQLTEHEEQQVIADYLNKQAAALAGVTVKDLKASGQGYKAEDVDVTRNHIDLWRMKKPNAIQVVSKFVKGKRRYYQITDPQIFKVCARGEDIGQFFRFFENIFAPMSKNFRGTVTQLWPFAVGNLALRDSGTAMILGDQKNKVTYLQGLYAAKGIINRMTGKHENVFGRSELLSQTLDDLTKDTHRSKVENLVGILGEGIVVKDWSGMTWLERIENIPGQILAVGLKPIDIANWLLGSRWAAQRGEEITREGGAVAMKERGASEARTLQAYETISGNFGQRGRSAHFASLMRMIPFVNAGIQVLGQTIEKTTDADPANRALFFAVKLPYLAAVGGLIAAGRILLTLALHPDEDDRKEIFEQERERPYNDRLGWINIEGLRLPFGYGIPGSIQSYGYNKVMEWFLEDPIPPDVKIKALLKRANDIPGVSTFLPNVPKTLIELNLNHSFFFDNDIVPNWMLEKYEEEPERQAWPNTPQLYKQIGSGLKISPIKLQYAVRSIFTSEMNALVRALDPRPYESKSEWPVIGRLITRPAEGYGSQAIQTVQDMDDQWSILRSKVRYLEETDGDTNKVKKLQQQINKLTIAHQVMHEVTALWNDVKEEYRKPEPDYDIIKSRKRLMTEKARKFIKWDMAGRKGKFPAGIISDEYRNSLVKQRNMQPTPRRKGEPLADYTKRYQKVMGQKRNAAEILKLL